MKITLKEIEKRKKQFIRRLDDMASYCVRQHETSCVSCGKYLQDFKKRQCGHFIRRECWKTRWDPRNLHTECAPCNGFSPDHLVGYSKRLMEWEMFEPLYKIYESFITKKITNEFCYTEAKKWYEFWMKVSKDIDSPIPKKNWDDLSKFDILEEKYG